MSRGAPALLVVVVLLITACSDDREGAVLEEPTNQEPPTTTAGPPLATSLSLPTAVDVPTDLPGYHVHRPADLAATASPLPVVVWANGGCVRHDETWHVVLDRWASAGFVVVAISTPPPLAPGETPLPPTSTAADQAAAIDWAQAQADGTGPYAGHLDLDRVVAAGNSCGGITSLQLAGQDDRVAAVFVLSGSSVGPGASREAAEAVMTHVTAPVGFAVGGEEEDIASPQAHQDYDVLPAGVPGMVANRSSGDHVRVSTDERILADVAGIGLNWMDLALYGTPAAEEALTSDPCGGCRGNWDVQAKHLDTLVAD